MTVAGMCITCMDAQRKRPLEDLVLEHGVATQVQLVLDDIPVNYEK